MSWMRKNVLWWAFGGAVAMAFAIWGTWQGVHYTSSTEFCLSCHSMRTVGEEYQTSIHFRNASGVRASVGLPYSTRHRSDASAQNGSLERHLPYVYFTVYRYPGKVYRQAGRTCSEGVGANERQ